MNYWKVLGVKTGSDKKTIKLAYAKLLKKTRPDDDPEGFKSLHAAYKSALAHNSSQPSYDDHEEEYSASNPWPVAAVEEKVARPIQQQVLPDFIINNDVTEEASESREYDDSFAMLDQDWDAANAKAQALMRSPQRANKVSEWRFIELIPSIVDLEFRIQLSDHLFGMVAEANEISLEHKSLYIKAPVLDYLNKFFHWDQNWSHLGDEHGYYMLDCVLPFLSEENSGGGIFGELKSSKVGRVFIRWKSLIHLSIVLLWLAWAAWRLWLAYFV